MKELDNLVKINLLKSEAVSKDEFSGMLLAGETKLNDALIKGLSEDSKFTLAMGRLMLFHWPLYAGMATDQINDIWYSNVCSILWA